MRLSSIPAIRRNLHRAREIVGVLSKYGLAEWIRWLGPRFAQDFMKTPEGTSIARQPLPVRLRLAMIELGPGTIKLGQFLSTRPDLVGVDLADELKSLQADIPADDFETVRSTIETALDRPLEEVYSEFEETPIASASIGQVHRARLLATGEAVVVKVQHPRIQHRLEVDLDIAAALAQLAERFPDLENYNPSAVVDAFRRSLLREIDFRREARNMERFARNFSKNATVRIPRVYRAYSTKNVLTMERLDGVKLSDREQLERLGYDVEEIVRRGASLYMEMIFEHRFYHADPHPGNILVLEDNTIGLLDYGSVGQLDESLQESVEDLLMAVAAGDTQLLSSIIIRLGQPPSDLDRDALSLDLEEFVGYFGSQSIETFDLSAALNEMVEIIRRYQIRLNPRLAVLIKVLVTLEGTAQQLSPRFSLLDVLRPHHMRLLRRRLSPRRHFRKIRRAFSHIERALEILPEGMLDLFQRIQSGKATVHLDHQGLEPSVNRLVLGMLTSSLFLGGSHMVSQNVRPLVRQLVIFDWVPLVQEVSVPGLIGIVLSVMLGLRLYLAITHTGNLD